MKYTLLLISWITTAAMGQSLPFLLGGIQVNEPNHTAWVEGLEDAGMNTVAVTAYAKQGDWNSDHLWWEAEEPSVVAEMVAAKAAGLRVVFIARVALDHAFAANAHYWHGSIMPRTPQQLESWFAQYTSFVMKWARICDSLEVDVFGIGSEMRVLAATVPTQDIPRLEGFFLNPLLRSAYLGTRWQHRKEIEASPWWQAQNRGAFYPQVRQEVHAQQQWAREVTYWGERHRIARLNERRGQQEALWRSLIAQVRTVYTGQLTYAANFDNFHRVGFWDALDMVGINAYFPLTESEALPTTEALAARWAQLGVEVQQVQAQLQVPNHPVLFTELGYIRRAGTLIAPWSGFGYSIRPKGTFGHTFHLWSAQPQRLQDRARAVSGLAQTHHQHWPQLAGILYWKLTTLPSMGAIEPFALVLGTDDPLEAALREFTPPLE